MASRAGFTTGQFLFLFAVKKKVKEKRPRSILVKSLRSGFKNKILKSAPQHADSQIDFLILLSKVFQRPAVSFILHFKYFISTKWIYYENVKRRKARLN